MFVKIPATEAGIPAIEDAIAEGININVTLMFSVDVYRARGARLRRRPASAARARRGRHPRRERGELLRQPRRHQGRQAYLDELGTDAALGPRGQAAIANAKLAYEAFNEIFGGDEFADLLLAGARVQRCLWASTSTKNPDYRDVLYVEELIGPQTVDTMPLETIKAFIDHGMLERTLDRDLDGAHAGASARSRRRGSPWSASPMS